MTIHTVVSVQCDCFDWLHEEGLYPMMSRSLDEHADGDEEDTSEQ